MTQSTEKNTPQITIIVLNYNSGTYLTRCLTALGDQDFEDFSVIVADNGSSDDSFTQARELMRDRRFRFEDIGENTGFARGNNLMVAKVQAPFVVLLNPDAIPNPDWLRTLVEFGTQNPDVAMFGSTQLRLDSPSVLDGVGDNYLAYGVPWRGGYGHRIENAPPTREVFSPCGAAAMYRTLVFREHGGFDERYFCYVEDVDLGFRMRLRGARCLQVSEAIVSHAGGISSAGDNHYFSIFHGTRNMIWTFVKNMPGLLFWPLLPMHIAILCVLVIRAALRKNTKPTVGGIVSACKGLPQIWATRREIQRNRKLGARAIASTFCWSIFPFLKRAPYSFRTHAAQVTHKL